MKKNIIALFLALTLTLSLASALSLGINEKPIANVVAVEFSNPAVYELTIDNAGYEEEVEIFSLSGVDITPREFFALPHGENIIEIQVTPQESLIDRLKGLFSFEYKIQNHDGDFIKSKLTMNLVQLEKILKITALPITPEDDSAVLIINNTKSSQFNDLKLELSSPFFTKETSISLEPFESTQLSIPIQKEQTGKISAGSYVITAKASYKSASSQLSGTIDYLARESMTTKSHIEGLFIKKTELARKNTGNTDIKASLTYEQNIITRLFTTFSENPASIKRKALKVEYSWERNIAPQESLEITATTNYTLPFFLILFVVIIAVLVRIYYTTKLILSKRVSFVKTKGGEFALKVNLHIKARKPVTDVVIEDRLPPAVKLYEKSGRAPDSINPANRTLSWKLPHLEAGEERFFSYIIYSKLKIFGTFNLPSAKAVFSHNNLKETIFSNQTSFLAESAAQD